MQSLSIDQLLISGLAPLSYASQHLVCHLLDMDILEEHSINDISKFSTPTFTTRLFKSDISIPFDDFSQQSVSSDDITPAILTHSSFLNKNLTILLRAALISGTTSFRRALHDFKMTHKRIFAQEINQHDKHQNTLLWYLSIAGLYSSIEELYRLAFVELNVNVKNGLFNQTILHYTIIHGNTKEIQIVLDLGIDTNLCDRFGRTALHYIALYGSKYKNDVEIVKLLIDHGILLKYGFKQILEQNKLILLLCSSEDNIGQTSLHFAIIKENYDLVEYFITLSNINVCIRDKYGYTSLCYLCEHILSLSDVSLENNQCADTLDQIFKMITQIVDRCPSDKLSDNFHITSNNKLGENLFLHVYYKLTNLTLSFHINSLFHRLESILIGTDRDHRLFVERLLDLHSWKSAIIALCNTHNVNISNALIQCIAHDPHVLLFNAISPSSDVSIVFALVFYALATDVTLLQGLVPMCKYVNKQETKSLTVDDEVCCLCINNYKLHTNYVTFMHTCLHYASANVFSLKHLCRYYIRRCFKSPIIEKTEQCSYLKSKHRDYLKLNELSLIYSGTHDLSFIVYLIKRLYNIHDIDEYNFFENEISDHVEQPLKIPMENVDVSPADTSSDSDTVQNVVNRSDKMKNENESIKPIRERTIEEIMAESDISFHDSSDDQIESKHLPQSSLKTSMKDIDLTFETNHKSQFSFSDDEISTEQFENELADMQTKSKDIEEMIEKFLLNK